MCEEKTQLSDNEQIYVHNNYGAFDSIGNDIENNVEDDETTSTPIFKDVDVYDEFELSTQGKRKPYLHGSELRAEWEKCKAQNKASLELLKMFEKIAKNYSKKFRCKNKCDEDANINYAMFEAYRKFDTYDPKVSTNIFAFFTQMIKNDLAQSNNDLTKLKNHISIDSLFNANNND